MILVDTSVWIDHFRAPEQRLADLIRRRSALIHPYVLSEVMIGNLSDWHRTVAGLQTLPRTEILKEDDLIAFVAERKLQGSGLGFVDAELLAITQRLEDAKLWTRDKRLMTAAQALGIRWTEMDVN